MNKSSPIGELKGIGTKTSELFEKMGVYTVGDILLRFPRNYVQYPKAINFTPEFSQGSLPPGENCAIKAAVTKSPVVKQTRKMPVTVLALGFGETVLEMVWYRMPYVKNQVQPGKQYVFYGKVTPKAPVW
jgi:ATP-dependent DNA helicase RecG